jgi:hypothetical protein
MSKQLGLTEYRADQKNAWRGWQWNRIVERLTVPVEDATVLYLCGPEDIDREKALRLGFTNENLIAVDVDEESIRRVRASGGLGIAHDLTELVESWPREWPIDVVVADFHCGLNNMTMGFLDALCRGANLPVVSMNAQRGRDAQSAELRAEAVDDLILAVPPSSEHVHPYQFNRKTRRKLRHVISHVDRVVDDCWKHIEAKQKHRSTAVMKPRDIMGRGAEPRPAATAKRKIAALKAMRTMKTRAA